MKYTKSYTLPSKVKRIHDNLPSRQRKGFLKVFYGFHKKFKYDYLRNYHRGTKYEGYTSIPRNYLRSINGNYYKYRDILLKEGIIDYYKPNEGRKYYDTERKVCMKYKPLIDFNSGSCEHIELENPNTSKNYYKITKDSLKQVGLTPTIKRCTHGRRLHTPITSKIHEEITSYKGFFAAQTENYYAIDAKACQPTLLLHYFKKNGWEIDEEYREALSDDFYDYLGDSPRIGVTTREQAKKLFTLWLNGPASNSNIMSNIFPKMTSQLKYRKGNDFKKIGSDLTRMESDLFIDGILNNIGQTGIDFCLTVHDSIVVKEKDLNKAKNYCSAAGAIYDMKFNFEKL